MSLYWSIYYVFRVEYKLNTFKLSQRVGVRVWIGFSNLQQPSFFNSTLFFQFWRESLLVIYYVFGVEYKLNTFNLSQRVGLSVWIGFSNLLSSMKPSFFCCLLIWEIHF